MTSEGKNSALTKLFNKIPKKHHFEALGALLSIPVLLTVITVNVINIQSSKTPKPTPTPEARIVIVPEKEDNTPSVKECKKTSRTGLNCVSS